MLQEELEPTSEAADHYLGADILFLKLDQIARVHLGAQQRDNKDNAMRRIHANPFLDMRVYQVEFPGVTITELSANVIAESI